MPSVLLHFDAVLGIGLDSLRDKTERKIRIE